MITASFEINETEEGCVISGTIASGPLGATQAEAEAAEQLLRFAEGNTGETPEELFGEHVNN